MFDRLTVQYLKYSNGDVYEGQCEDGKQHGKRESISTTELYMKESVRKVSNMDKGKTHM